MKRRLLVTLLLAGAIAAGITAVQVYASGGTAPIYRTPDGHSCAFGAADTFDWVGHFHVDEKGATLYGTVVLDGVAAHSTFEITLVQNHPCKTMDVGPLQTDGHGNGEMSFQAPAVPGASEAWILTFHDHVHQIASTPVPFS